MKFGILLAMLLVITAGFSLAFIHVFNQLDHIDCETHVIQQKPC